VDTRKHRKMTRVDIQHQMNFDLVEWTLSLLMWFGKNVQHFGINIFYVILKLGTMFYIYF
jgi:hypothetical protein